MFIRERINYKKSLDREKSKILYQLKNIKYHMVNIGRRYQRIEKKEIGGN